MKENYYKQLCTMCKNLSEEQLKEMIEYANAFIYETMYADSPINYYQILKNERERWSGYGVKVAFDNELTRMTYTDETGTLTVKFIETDGSCEEFYWKSVNDKKRGIGKLCYETYECPVTTATLIKGSIQATSDLDLLAEMPEKMVQITQDYQFERDSVGLEEKPILKYSYEK